MPERVKGQVRLRVFDVSGRSVRTLQNGFRRPGVYTLNWDGRDDAGRSVAHGVYFYHLTTPGLVSDTDGGDSRHFRGHSRT